MLAAVISDLLSGHGLRLSFFVNSLGSCRCIAVPVDAMVNLGLREAFFCS